jgi:WD40 repeat protein
MAEWKDYYDVLGLDPKATDAEIKEVYRKRVKRIHPDRFQKDPTAKHRAEEDFKREREAYEVLIDPERRRRYDSEWLQRKQAPKPIVTPPVIRFEDVIPREVQTASFILENQGGPYSEDIVCNSRSPWIRIMQPYSVNPSSELPLQFGVEAVGEEWGKHYEGYIKVWLDDQVALVKVELETKAEAESPRPPFVTKTSPGTATVGQPTSSRVMGTLLGVVAGLLIGGAITYAIIFHTGRFGPTIGRILVGAGITSVVWMIGLGVSFLFKSGVFLIFGVIAAIGGGVSAARTVSDFDANLVALGVLTISFVVGGGFAGYKAVENNIFPQIIRQKSIWTKRVLISASIVALILLGFGLRRVLVPPSEDLSAYQGSTVDSVGQEGSVPGSENIPAVDIASPRANSTFVEGDKIYFELGKTDLTEEQLPGDLLVWFSSLQGEIGKGRYFARDDLMPGTHVIHLRILLEEIFSQEGSERRYKMEDKVVITINESPGNVLWSYEGEGSLNSVSVSSNGSYIVVGSSDGVRLLDHDEGLLWEYPTDFPIVDVTVSPNGDYILAGGSEGGYVIPDGVVYCLDKQGDLVWSIETTSVSSISLAPEGGYYAMTYLHGLGWNDVVGLCGPKQWLWTDSFGKPGTTAVGVSADGENVVVGGSSEATTTLGEVGGVRFYNKSGDLLWEHKIGGSYFEGGRYSVAISSNGKYAVAGYREDEKLYFFDRDRGLLWNYETGPIEGVSISGDGEYIAAASSNTVYLFNRQKSLLWTLKSQIRDIDDVSLSTDAEIIAVIAEGRKVHNFNVGEFTGY